MAVPGMTETGTSPNIVDEWEGSNFETKDAKNSKWGMIYRASAGLNERTKVIADELKTMLDSPNVEVDNPLVLGKITALSGNYNMARQLQSNVMKSIKDAAQAIIRNV